MEVTKDQKMTGKQMQPATSDKTFHLKWNNHLQNLSQLFTAIYSSSALADVTLSCRDGAIRAHKLVLSACSPYFEQIFRDNPCKHPVVILKGIPYAEINLLVEFMYKGSVDVQEIDLQSLMHTASELEVRGLAYELRKDASSLLNVNLNEYPTFNSNQTSDAAFAATAAEPATTANASYESAPCTPNAFQSNLERLHQIHLYQQSMCRSTPYSQTQSASNLASEIKRKRKNEDPMTANTTTAVKNILAAAAKELAEKKNVTVKTKTSTCIQTEDEGLDLKTENYESDSGETEAAPESEEPAHGRDTRFKGKKRVSVGMSEDFPTTPRILAKSKQGRKNSIKLSIKAPHSSNSLPADESEDGISNVIISAVTGASDVQMPPQGILKCVNLNDLREAPEDNNVTVIDDDDSSAVDTSDENNLLVEASYESPQGQEEEYDSSDSKNGGQKPDDRIFKCDICSLSFVRKFHMKRHRRTHTGERPFQCDDCPFSFNRSSHLARHRRTHTGERPYRCEACGRTFTRGDKLKLHLRICEKDEYVLPSRLNTEDPSKQIKKDLTQTMLPGMVSIGHNERHQLMFTASGDVVLAPRSQSESMGDVTNTTALSELSESNQSALTLSDLNTSKLNLSIMSTQPSTSDSLLSNQYFSLDASGYPIKRGRGRPRKKPLPVVVPLIKKKRGRPPKIIKLDPMDTSNRPMENYNVSNLPYGDFSYLTDILSTHFNQSNPQAYQNMIQLNPMLENAKFAANIISNAVAQSTMSASITNAMNTPEPCKTVTVITKDDTTIPSGITVIPQTSNKDDSQPITATENATEKTQEPSTENTSAIVENQNSTLNENDCAITDLTSDKEDAAEEDLGENVSNENNALNDKIEQSMRIGDCQVSKVVSHPKLDVNAFASSLNQISTLGECTIKPVAKND